MPAHNEGEHIEIGVREWYDVVIARIPGSEIVVVDDCSTDDTGARLQTLAGQLPRLRVLTTAANAGHGPAVRYGLDRCDAEFVFQTDSDRQHTPDDFSRLWDRRHEADFVFGVRERRADGPFRQFVALGLRVANLLLWRRWIRDANCPFKLMRRDPLNDVLAEIPRDSFIPMVMVSVLAHHHGYRVIEVPVRHFARSAGQQSLSGLAKWGRTGTRCARQLMTLRLSASDRTVRNR